MRVLKRHCCLVALIFVSAGALLADGELVRRTWQVDGTEREALLYAPSEAKPSPRPLVFAFHGHGGTMAQAARTFNYHTHWPEAIVVYMQGLNTPGRLTDLEGKKPGWQHAVGDHNDRDLKFFDSVLETLKAELQVDVARIYSTGHSNGGGFTYLLWGYRGDVFAAMAPSSALPSAEGSKALKPKPALHLAGENDPLVKYEWQKVAIDSVRKLNGCETIGKPWAQSGKLVGTQFESGIGTTFVTLIHPGKHEFPTDAPKLFVRFFQEHPPIKASPIKD